MKYYFVVDTDAYAGNFERQLCAFITGITGECGAATDIAEKVKDQLNVDFDELVGSEPDEHGIHRPVKIYPTPGYYNNGLGFAYQKGEEQKAIEAYRQNCIDYGNKKFYGNGTDAQEEHRKKWHNSADNAETEYGHYPSYQSIAILFYDKPGDDVMALMKERAEELASASRDGTSEVLCGDKWIGPFTISGFRWVTEKITSEEEEL